MLTTALVAFGAASPAFADEVVIEHPPTMRQGGCGNTGVPLGQTFTATATGALTEVGYWTWLVFNDHTTELRVRADGPSGAILAAQDVTFHASSATPGLQSFTLDVPVPVVEGQVYAFEIANGTCNSGVNLADNFSDYSGGAQYNENGFGLGDQTFRLVIETDGDADGVADSADQCAGTTFSPGPAKLKKNQFWSPTVDGFLDGTGTVAYTLADTGGCSAEQIIAAAKLGKGHIKTGISIGELQAWVASVAG
ncbi:DUF4082 domain-containing protein [Agromyces sp. NPDC004153]